MDYSKFFTKLIMKRLKTKATTKADETEMAMAAIKNGSYTKGSRIKVCYFLIISYQFSDECADLSIKVSTPVLV